MVHFSIPFHSCHQYATPMGGADISSSGWEYMDVDVACESLGCPSSRLFLDKYVQMDDLLEPAPKDDRAIPIPPSVLPPKFPTADSSNCIAVRACLSSPLSVEYMDVELTVEGLCVNGGDFGVDRFCSPDRFRGRL